MKILLSAAFVILAGSAQAQIVEPLPVTPWHCDTVFWGWLPNCGAGRTSEPSPVVTTVNTQVEVDCPEPEYPTYPPRPPVGVPPVTGELPNGNPFPGRGPKRTIAVPQCETCYRTRTTYYVNGISTGSTWSRKQSEITVVSNKTQTMNSSSGSRSSGGSHSKSK